MLDPRRDRVDYGEMLCPPPGYRFDRAVAATYSANMETLLSIPVALVYSQTLEGDLSGAGIQMLEAIKRFSDRVRVFHQKGQIHVPFKANWLYAYLEEALVPIHMDDPHACFHPKIWVIRYTHLDADDPEGENAQNPSLFRAIILSRNLDFSRSWDLAVKLEGEVGSSIVEGNRPLVGFLRWLHDKAPIAWIEPFLDQLARVDFQTPDPFAEHVFRPMGISGYDRDPTQGIQSKRTLVMSPFLDKTTIDRLRKQTTGNSFLFGEPHEMERLPVDLLRHLRCYQLSEMIVDGESLAAAEEGASEAQKQNLHAKLYIFQTEEGFRWFLGSANATQAARTRNIEFLLELKGESGRARIRPILKDLRGEEDGDGPFVPFPPEKGGRIDGEMLDREGDARLFEYELLSSEITARAEPAEVAGNFNLRVLLDLGRVTPARGFEATVRPFNTNTSHPPLSLRPGEKHDHVFFNLAEVELSRFFCFRIHDRELDTAHVFLVRVEVEHLPADRLENILRKVIDSQDKFFEYLRFLLADEITKEDLLGPLAIEQPSESAPVTGELWAEQLPIYEKLLVVSARSPSRLAEVDDLIRELADKSTTNEASSVVPPAFLSFWVTFHDLIPPKRLPET